MTETTLGSSTAKGVIFVGRSAFDKLVKHLSILYPCAEIKSHGVRFKLDEALETNTMATIDSELVDVLKEVEKELAE